MAKPQQDTRSFLKFVRLFSELPDQTLCAIADCVERHTFAAGETLFNEGDPGNSMFVIETGRVQVQKAGQQGSQVTLRIMEPGEVGGMTSMAYEKTRSATLRAHDDVSLLCINRDRFQRLLDEHPPLVRAVMAFLSAKVRGKTSQLASLLEDQPSDTRVSVAFFDTKPYDETSFTERNEDELNIRYIESRLGPDTAQLATGCPVVCAFVNDEIHAETLEQLAASGVQLLAMRCAGYNNIDLKAAAQHNISVVRVPAYSPYAVAEHAVALILTLNRSTHRAYNRVREGNFSLKGLVGFDLHGRTAGIVGLGKIGRCLADALMGFGMKVIAYDAFPDEDYGKRSGVRFVDLDMLIEQSKIVSLHAPLTPDTYHMINADRIKRMKRDAMLINTSRGGLVDAAALIDGLKSGQIGSAGLDVYEEESEYFFEDRSDRAITDDLLARLMTFPNVLITSHQGFLTHEALANIAETTLSNIREFLEGKRGKALTNVVLPMPEQQ